MSYRRARCTRVVSVSCEYAPASTREYGEPAVPFENNAAQQFVQMDQLARLPGERDREKERERLNVDEEKEIEREIETKRERKGEGGRKGKRLPQGDSTILRTYQRTMAACTRRRRIFGHTCPAHK